MSFTIDSEGLSEPYDVNFYTSIHRLGPAVHTPSFIDSQRSVMVEPFYLILEVCVLQRTYARVVIVFILTF